MTLSDLQLLGCLLLLVYMARRLFISLLANIATFRRGWYAVLLVLVTCLGMPIIIGMLGENRSLLSFTHIETPPWSVVLGGIIVLPMAILVVAGSASYWYDKELVLASWWRWTSALIGLASGALFHHWFAARNPGITGSLTLLWYEYAAIPIMVSALVWAGVLVFRYASTAHRVALAILLVIQLSLMAIDTNRGLDPTQYLTTCNMVCGSQNVGDHLHDLLNWLVGVAT